VIKIGIVDVLAQKSKNISPILPVASPQFRSNQRDEVELSGLSPSLVREKGRNSWYVRFWLDVPGQPQRAYKRVKLCPIEGSGALNAFERKRRAKEIIAQFGANSEEVFRAAEAVNLGTTFKQQAERWLEAVQTRKRNPVKLRTATTWSSYLRYINLHLGEVPLAEVNNRTVKGFIATMSAEMRKERPRFSPKSITSYVEVVKLVVASALDGEGEEIYPVKWKDGYMDLPHVGKKRKPTFTVQEVSTIVSKTEGQERLLYALLAGSGLRIGEALALQVEDVDGSVLSVDKTLWNGRLSSPKTENGIRKVDLHSSLASLLSQHIGDRRSGFVFRTSVGTPESAKNVLDRSLHQILEKMGRETCGFHGFRRFRNAHLEKQRVPDYLVRFWVGHSNRGVTDEYKLQLRDDLPWRQEYGERSGIGFDLPS